MIIHVVKSGETIDSIATEYGLDPYRIIQYNNIINPQKLAVGQPIIIVYPKQTHIVQEGDSLSAIANEYGITIKQLLRYNPFLLDREFIYPGETLVISYTDIKNGHIKINGYAYPYIDRNILQKNLLYLTYISIFYYSITAEGTLNDIDDMEIISMAKSFRVAPIMVISTLNEEGTTNTAFLNSILYSEEKRNQLIDTILNVIKKKGYYGLSLETSYILDKDRVLYFSLFSALRVKLNQEGVKLFLTIAPDTFEHAPKSEYLTANYAVLNDISDGITILPYSWGSISDIPFEASSYYLLETLLEFILQKISPEKITVGFSSIGYIFQLPYITEESKANAISISHAIQMAADAGAVIHYNPNNLYSYFYVKDTDLYLINFHDIRGVDTFLNTLTMHGVKSAAIWNIMYYLGQTFLLIHTLYDIDEIL